LALLARKALVKTNHCAVAIMSIGLSVWDRCALWSYGAFQHEYKSMFG